jgi:hypothetical protein
MTLYICDHPDSCPWDICPHFDRHSEIHRCSTHDKIHFCPYPYNSYCNAVKEEPMFKVGDEVRILGNSTEEQLSKAPYNVGDIDEVYIINGNLIHLSKNPYLVFYPSDLELVKEPAMDKKYKLLKPITLRAMEEAGTSNVCPEFISFAKKAIDHGCGVNGEIPLGHALAWRQTNFLFDKGFIGEEEEVFYKKGDRFQLKDDESIFGLAPVSNNPNMVQLINSDFTTFYGEPIAVESFYKIPHCLIDERLRDEEFTKI